MRQSSRRGLAEDSVAPAYYAALARAKLIARNMAASRLLRFLAGAPLLVKAGRRANRWAAGILLPKQPCWVQVQSGFARGLWLCLDLDIEGGYWIGTYEARVQGFLEERCRPGCIFYDIGASLSFFSLAVARAIGLNGRVFAFEPEARNCRRVREMAFRNGLQDRVELVEAAVWSRTVASGAPFRRGGRQDTYGGVSADGVIPVLAEGEMLLIPLITLDEFIRLGHPAPDVLKIDVEGGECEVLKGGETLFSRARPALICEVHREEGALWIEEWLAARRYAAVWYVPKEGFPRLMMADPCERALAKAEGRRWK